MRIDFKLKKKIFFEPDSAPKLRTCSTWRIKFNRNKNSYQNL